MRVAAVRRSMPSSSACSMECLRTKFWSRGSSASAAIFTARSRRFIWLMKRSLKTPEQETTVSIRGRPSSSRGIRRSLFTRPMLSAMGSTPTSHMACARDSPYVLMLSVPHRVRATDSGQTPPLSIFWRSTRRSTTTFAHLTAAEVGIDCGSRACMFFPVGSTLGLRMGSPPGPGVMYSPLSADMRPPSSLSATTCSRQNPRYLNSGVSSLSSTLKPSSLSALRHGVWIPTKPWRVTARGLTASMRPSALALSMAAALTAARVASTICWRSATSSSTPLSELR
mmetsp:Transcript_22440/g.45044  ORF Transcript_22440/g.45044 Transcript_22440/m.45044 type:complete len:283 (+) Transcript_22440:1411-2259(+)